MHSTLLLLVLLRPPTPAQTPTPVAARATTAEVDEADDLRREARAAMRQANSEPEALLALAQRARAAGDGRTLLELLDAVLERAPDHGPTLAWLHEVQDLVRLELALPQAPEVWQLEQPELERRIAAAFAAAGGWPATPRELVVLRLAEAAHPEFVHATSLAELRAPTPGRRAFAALVLRRLFPGRDADPLIERSLLDPSAEVRTQAALALASVADPAVAAPAVRALGASQPALRLHAAQALGWMGYTEAVAPLAEALFSPVQSSSFGPRAPRAYAFFGTQTAYVQDFDVEVANGSSIADPAVGVLGSGAVLDVRVLGTSSSPASFRDAARASLRRLTGEDPGRKDAAWRAWWADSPFNPERADAARDR